MCLSAGVRSDPASLWSRRERSPAHLPLRKRGPAYPRVDKSHQGAFPRLRSSRQNVPHLAALSPLHRGTAARWRTDRTPTVGDLRSISSRARLSTPARIVCRPSSRYEVVITLTRSKVLVVTSEARRRPYTSLTNAGGQRNCSERRPSKGIRPADTPGRC